MCIARDNLLLETLFMLDPPKWNIGLLLIFANLYLEPINIYSVLVVLILSLFARSHSLTFQSRSSVKRVSSSRPHLPWIVRIESSANILGVEDLRQFGKSFMHRRKSNGPGTYP